MLIVGVSVLLTGVAVSFDAIAADTAVSVPRASTIKVLVIGDSHTAGLFGHTLDQHLRGGGLEVETHARPGATADWFFTGENRTAYAGFDRELGALKGTRAARVPTPKLPALLAQVHPDWTVVALGSNSMWLERRRLGDELRRVMTAIRAGGSQCIWVAPPDMGSVPDSARAAFYRALSDVSNESGCAFVDSFKILGKHPTCAGVRGPCDPIHWDGYPDRAKAWGHAVGERVIEIARPSSKAEK